MNTDLDVKEITRVALADASAALDIVYSALTTFGNALDRISSAQSQVPESPPATPAPVAQYLSDFSRVMTRLEDPRFTLRSVSSLLENTSLGDNADLFHLLRSHDVCFVTRTRRSDGELLVGLCARN